MRHSIKRTIVSVLACCALAFAALFGMGGCASTSDSAASALNPGFDVQDIQIKSSGYTLGENNELRYAFTAINPNEGHLAQNVMFTIQAYDVDNQMVGAAGITIPIMYPQQSEAAAGKTEVYASVAGSANAGSSATASAADKALEVAYLEIRPMMDTISWSDTTYNQAKVAENLKTADATIIQSSATNNSGYPTLNITANVTTTFESVNLQAIAILTDAAGNPICGSDPVSFDCAKDSEPYNLKLTIPNAPEYENCSIFLYPLTVLS